jgi:two-component system response regulator NreC
MQLTSATQSIRVLLVEDHTIVREGLRAMLMMRADMEVVGEAEDGLRAVEEAKRLAPDVVVMDLNLPKLSGLDATRAIKDALPDTKVLVLSMYGGAEHVRPALRAGASGYLVKGTGVAELVSGILAVSKGQAYFSHDVAAHLLREEQGSTSLTARELEVLKLVASGMSSQEIADSLSLSIKTVESHRSRVMTKLDVTNVAMLVRESIRLGLVTAD